MGVAFVPYRMRFVQEIREGGLVLQLHEDQNLLRVAWSGRCHDVRPSVFLEPFLAQILGDMQRTGRRLVLDFSPMEHMESEVLGPVAQLLDRARQLDFEVTVYYDEARPWQDVDFTFLSVFHSDRIRILPVEPPQGADPEP